MEKIHRRARILLILALLLAVLLTLSSCKQGFETITTSEYIELGGQSPSNFVRVGAIRDAVGDKILFHVYPAINLEQGSYLELLTVDSLNHRLYSESRANNIIQSPLTYSRMNYLLNNEVVAVRVFDGTYDHTIKVTNKDAFRLLIDRVNWEK